MRSALTIVLNLSHSHLLSVPQLLNGCDAHLLVSIHAAARCLCPRASSAIAGLATSWNSARADALDGMQSANMPRRLRRSATYCPIGQPGQWARRRRGRLPHIAPSIFQVLSEHWLRGIEAAVEDGGEQAVVCARGLGQRLVAALPLQRSGGGVDEREIPARRILNFEQLVRHLGIAFLSQHVHQRHGPEPALGVGDELTLQVLPVVHAPHGHIYASRWSFSSNPSSALATCDPVKGLGTSETFRARRERRLASASSGVSLTMTTGSSA